MSAGLESGARLAGWAYALDPPGPEATRSRVLARVGGLTAIAALLAYLSWRITSTLPPEGWDRTAAWILIAFEALPLLGLSVRLFTLWNIDSRAPRTVTELPADFRVAVFIPTYNEPVEVIAPTIAAACALAGAVEGLPPGVPVAATTSRTRQSRALAAIAATTSQGARA